MKSANPAQQQLHQENMDLKRTLREIAPSGNPRAEAAERSLFEIRKTFVSLAIKAVPVRFADMRLPRPKIPTPAFSSMEWATRSAQLLLIAI